MLKVFIAFDNKDNHPLVGRIRDRLRGAGFDILGVPAEVNGGKSLTASQQQGSANCDVFLVMFEKQKGFSKIFNRKFLKPVFSADVVEQIKTAISRSESAECVIIPVLLDTNTMPHQYLPKELKSLGNKKAIPIRKADDDFESDIEKLLSSITSAFPDKDLPLSSATNESNAPSEKTVFYWNWILGFLVVGIPALCGFVEFVLPFTMEQIDIRATQRSIQVTDTEIAQATSDAVTLTASAVVVSGLATDTATPTETLPPTTVVPTATEIPSAMATVASLATSVPLPTASDIPPATPTYTYTYTPTATDTLTPTATVTNTPSPTSMPSATFTPTPTNTATYTPTPTNTETYTSTPTNTSTVTSILTRDIGGPIGSATSPPLRIVPTLTSTPYYEILIATGSLTFEYTPLVTFGAYVECIVATDFEATIGCFEPAGLISNPDSSEVATTVGWEDAQKFCEFVGGSLPTLTQLQNIYAFAPNAYSADLREWVQDAPLTLRNAESAIRNGISIFTTVSSDEQYDTDIAFRCVR